MELVWKKYYLDLFFIPLSLFASAVYHVWLWLKVRSHPLQTNIGTHNAGQRRWVLSMMKDEKNGVLAVQSMRNILMGLTLMATTSILLSSALAAVLSSSYSIKRPMKEAVMYGGRGDVMMGVKYVTVLVFFLLAFLFYCLSAKLINQVCFLINVRCDAGVASSYVCDLMEKMSLLHLIGDRLVYTALPLLTWIFGPVMVFGCSVFVVLPILYTVDVVYGPAKLSSVFGEDV